jgi:hypothetical protein
VPAITTSTLPGATVGTPYAATLTGAGGAPPYTWAIASGTPPAGLSLDASTGTISGTPTTSGTATFTVSLTDSSAPAQVLSRSLSIAVSPPSSSSPGPSPVPAPSPAPGGGYSPGPQPKTVLSIHLAGLNATVKVTVPAGVAVTATAEKVKGAFRSGSERIVISLTKRGKKWKGTVRVTDGKKLTRTFTETATVKRSGHTASGVASAKVKVRKGHHTVKKISTLHWSIVTDS